MYRCRHGMQLYPVSRPFVSVKMEIVAPFPRTIQFNKFVPLPTDCCLKQVQDTANFLTNKGRKIVSCLIVTTCILLGVMHARKTTQNPQTNRQPKRLQKIMFTKL